MVSNVNFLFGTTFVVHP